MKIHSKSIYKKHADLIVLVVLILLYTVVLSYLSIFKHSSFASGYDLSNMDQTIWNTLRGRFFTVTQSQHTVSRFSIHSDLILVLLAPLYIIWPNVRILLIFQSFMLGLGAIPTYLIAKKVLKWKTISIIISFLYLLNPALQWTNIYDFHPVSLAIPLLLFGMYFAFTKRWKWYFVAMILAALTKEEVPVTIAMIGVLIAIVQKEYLIAAITIFPSLLISWLSIKVIIPHFNNNDYMYIGWYQNLFNALKTYPPQELPFYILNTYFLNPDAILYYNLLLRPFAFMPLLGLPFLIISLPELSINLLSDHSQMRSIVLHYDSVVLPGLIISTIAGFWLLKTITNKYAYGKWKKISFYVLSACILYIGFRFNYHHSPLPTTPSCWCLMYRQSQEDIDFENALEKIPEKASVTASPEIRAHISHRENAYTLPDASETADYVAVITQNRLIGDYGKKKFEIELISKLLANPAYQLTFRSTHFYLFQRKP